VNATFDDLSIELEAVATGADDPPMPPTGGDGRRTYSGYIWGTSVYGSVPDA
jgi:hypothetical protein